MTVEDKLTEWLKQPGAFITNSQIQFIEQMREAAKAGVGYGWMQQIIEWEWQSKSAGALGPEYFERRIRGLDGSNASAQTPSAEHTT